MGLGISTPWEKYRLNTEAVGAYCENLLRLKEEIGSLERKIAEGHLERDNKTQFLDSLNLLQTKLYWCAKRDCINHYDRNVAIRRPYRKYGEGDDKVTSS